MTINCIISFPPLPLPEGFFPLAITELGYENLIKIFFKALLIFMSDLVFQNFNACVDNL